MIKLVYPVKASVDLTNGILFQTKFRTGTYSVTSNGRTFSVSMANNWFFCMRSTDGSLGGKIPQFHRVEYLDADTIVQQSNRHDYLNLYDTTLSSQLPKLSSGKVERPCHHESVYGTIGINPDISDITLNSDPSVLYPMYLSISSNNVASGGGIESVDLIEGTCLACANRATSTGWKSDPFLSPLCWLNMTHTYHWWVRQPWPNNSLTLEQAQALGIVKTVISSCNSEYAYHPNYPYYYYKDCVPLGDYDVKMYGAKLWGVSYKSLKSYSTSSHLDLPDIDTLKMQLNRDIPGLKALVSSKIKYLDEIWYNLILAGAKEIDRLDMNNIANLLEIPGMIRIFDKIYKQFVAFKDGSKVYKNPATGGIIKKVSCIYLGIHYGVKLTVMDLQEIIKTFKDNPSLLRQLRRRVVSYSKTSIDGTVYNCKSCMSPRSGREVTDIRDLSRILGLELSSLNLWDLVPWSFVVDWFIPISDILDSFENIARLESTYDLEYLIETVSRSEHVTWNGYDLQIKIYDRYITDCMPQFGFTVGDASGLNNHVIEASALVINSV